MEIYGNEKNCNSQDEKSVQERCQRRVRRVPDLLPVRLQDQLRRSEPVLREQGRFRKEQLRQKKRGC